VILVGLGWVRTTVRSALDLNCTQVNKIPCFHPAVNAVANGTDPLPSLESTTP
jgi:hypothetical protein